MNRNLKDVYCFIYDDNKHFYRATQTSDGSWIISSDSQMYPLTHSPRNLLDTPVEFATNKSYFSMNRTINYPLEFTFDGAAILNDKYTKGKGFNENLYLALFEFDSADGIFKLSYNGRFDFQQKKRNEKLATFTVSVIDDSAWGILSQNDDVQYAIDCSPTNPKAIKVLFDNFTLINRYTFQTAAAPITHATEDNTYTIPFVLVNEDGDSAGIVVKSQQFDSTDTVVLGGVLIPPPPDEYTVVSPNEFFYTYFPLLGVNFQGKFQFTWSTNTMPSGGLFIFFRSSRGQSVTIFQAPGGGLIAGKTYEVDFDFTLDFAPGEKLFFYAQLNDTASRQFTITPITTNVFVSTVTKAQPTICYGLRPLDLLKAIVGRGTLQRYTIDSDFFSINNKTILIPGDNLRGLPNGKIYTSFKDFFESFSALFFMALRVVNGSLFMELADEVYKQSGKIIELGELIECETMPATEYIPNEIQVGSSKQDYRHANGRLEFNCPFTFSLPFINIKNTISWISKYRTDCFGMIFLILDYQGGSTQDNSGDKSVFIADIIDEQASALDDVETFENININNSPLAPIIKFPLTGDIINNDKPVIRGIGIPGDPVNIYVADVLDGGTTVDGFGNWEYQIVTSLPSYSPGFFDGVNIINATNTDMTGPLSTIQLIIDTTVTAPIAITYPGLNDGLYNNLPLVKGIAPAGTNIGITLDGASVASVVTDNSCRWQYKFVSPIPNGNHILSIGVGTDVAFAVNAFTTFPLITYIGSELDGFPIVDNLPLIRGVGIPGTNVNIYLNYIPYRPLGTAVIDSFGDWSYQVVPLTYPDPITSIPVTMAPIRNGLSVISTQLIDQIVQVAVSGYKLNRPPYDSITGVPDNTVFNTRLSPKRMMNNHASMLSAIMDKQRNDVIHFETADKNSNLRTVFGTEVIEERADIVVSTEPIARLEKANIKCIARKNFAQTLYDFNNGGTIRGIFKGNEVWFMPIGSMSMKNILDDVQNWELLISPQTSYTQLLNLYKNGVTIELMTNSLFHSDLNTLHMVTYNYTQPDNFDFQEMGDDWFQNRNSQWTMNTPNQYIQKMQKTEQFVDQIVTNGISSATLRMYRCSDAKLITTFNYAPVNPAPIPPPEIVLEAAIDLTSFPEDQYFFVLFVGSTAVCISERIDLRAKFARTILINSRNSVNLPGYFFSTGASTIIRVEGLIKKMQPNIDYIVAKEESGDTKTLWSNVSKKRLIRFGRADGIPDYLAMKIAHAITNDGCNIEGQLYSLEENEKMQPSEDIDGVPLYYYEVNMTLQQNSQGKVFEGIPGSSDVTGVVLVVDASAIGLPTDVLININEQ